MRRVFLLPLIPLIAAGLAACASGSETASPTAAATGSGTGSGGLSADQTLCAAMQEGASAPANIAACTRIIETSDERAERVVAYNLRGIGHRRIGREGAALADFNAAIRLAPLYAPAHNNRAELYSARGEDKLAVESYRAAIRADPDNPASFNNYAWHLTTRGDYGGALTQVNRALALEGAQAAAFDTQAHALMGLGETAEAEAAFERAMELGGETVVRRYQRALSDKGYDPGGIDGAPDAGLRAGLAACIRDNCRLLLE